MAGRERAPRDCEDCGLEVECETQKRLNTEVTEVGEGKNGDTGARRVVSHFELTHQIIRAALAVHSELGPGLLESTYEACLAFELRKLGLDVKT